VLRKNQQRLKNELEFLPAVLEIQETPPLPIARWILWVIIVFFTTGAVWAWFGHVDIVGVATGKIVPSGRVKIIQPLESGTVRAIHVAGGQKVEKGRVLVELDSTLHGADRNSLRKQLLALRLDRARLLTILDVINNEPFTTHKPQTTTDHFSELTDATPAWIRLQRQRIRSRLNQYEARHASLVEQINEKRAEGKAVSHRIQKLDSTIPLTTEQAESLKRLVEADMAPRVQWLELEQERIEQVKEREVQRNNLKSLGAAINDLRRRQEEVQAEFESRILTELSEVENRLAALRQEQVKAEKRMALQRLVAPVSGRVHQLAVHTIGGVVTPAQELMRIVPDEESMEVEAWVPNKDIGFVWEGQPAEIKIQTFPFTKYGTIKGEILNVSDDATQDENMGLVYAARVSMQKTVMELEDKIVNLTPGMAVTVEINMGKRRLIEFLLSPLLRYKDESMKER